MKISSPPTRFIAVLLAALALGACGQNTPDAPSPGVGEIQATAPTFGSGPFNLVDPAAGLADLPGYRATLVLSFDGTRGGQAEQWSRTYTMLASQELAAHQLTIETTGQISGETPAPVLMAEMNGLRYERREAGPCTAAAVTEGRSLSGDWEPAAFLPILFGADEEGNETVSGIAAHHYTFDQHALGLSGIAQAVGAVWVATEDGYVAKYMLSIKGGADYFGEGTEGTVTWEYSLGEPGQPVTVEVPEDCPSGLVDAPLMDNAAEIHKRPGLTSFTTTSSMADVIAFYQSKLPALGWTVLGTGGASTTIGGLEFTKDNLTLTVIAMPSKNGTAVHLVVGDISATNFPGMEPTP